MNDKELEVFEQQFKSYMQVEMVQDPAHDLSHVLRVVKTAKSLCQQEDAKLEVVLPAAYLHDCFTFPKNHPERKNSSTVAAEKAETYLQSIHYPSEYLAEIKHAIMAHSYSAGITPTTIEAQIVQDADRLDAIGAIGIARCIQVGTGFGAHLYDYSDPYATERNLDDKTYMLDHFETKLFKLSDLMTTHSAKEEAKRRVTFMKAFLQQLDTEM